MVFGVWVVGSVVWGSGTGLLLPERSGDGRTAALREFLRCLVIQRRVRTVTAVVLAVFFAEHSCLQHGGEAFAVQELVAMAAVEGLAVWVLPRAA